MKILVLGHNGMLGHTIVKYFDSVKNFNVLTIESRWDENAFKTDVLKSNADFIVNCIGKIPQKDDSDISYDFLNINLPRFLEKTGIKIIHPSTDCEFKGDLEIGKSYSKKSTRDAVDAYGKSKAVISKEIEDSYQNTKIIRTSIIGHEKKTNYALLDWFLSQSQSVNGYTNHYWNGITTLQWAKECHKMILDWDKYPKLNQRATTKHYSKFDLLNIAKKVYKKNIQIIPFETNETINRCLLSDNSIEELESQLEELKTFFKK